MGVCSPSRGDRWRWAIAHVRVDAPRPPSEQPGVPDPLQQEPICKLTYVHSPKMNFDQVLSAIGGFGKFQKMLYVWICLPQILLAFHMLASIFTGSTPPHRCRESPVRAPGNQSSFPGALGLNFSLSESSCFSSDRRLRGNRTEQAACAHGWVYSEETFHSTTVTEVRYAHVHVTRAPARWSRWSRCINLCCTKNETN